MKKFAIRLFVLFAFLPYLNLSAAVSDEKPQAETCDSMLEFSSLGKVDVPHLDVRFNYPKEWSNHEESDKINTAILGEKEGSGKKGFIKYINVNIWPQPRSSSEIVAEETLNDDYYKLFRWADQKLDKTEKMTYDGVEGRKFVFTRDLEGSGELPIYKVVHFAPVGNCIVAIQCCLVADGDDDELQKRHLNEEVEKAKETFKEIGQSIRFVNKDVFIAEIMTNLIKTEFHNESRDEIWKTLAPMNRIEPKKTDSFTFSLEAPKDWESLDADDQEVMMIYARDEGKRVKIASLRAYVLDLAKFREEMKTEDGDDLERVYIAPIPESQTVIDSRPRKYGNRTGVMYLTKEIIENPKISGTLEVYSIYHGVLVGSKMLVVRCYVASNDPTKNEKGAAGEFCTYIPIFLLIGDSIQIEPLNENGD